MKRISQAVALAGVFLAGVPASGQVPAMPDVPIQKQPGDGLTLRPAPTVTRHHPADFIVQGDALQIFGVFTPHELSIWIEGTPGIKLPIVGRSAARSQDGTHWVMVQFPADYVSPVGGARLFGRHGTNGRSGFMTSVRVVQRPTATFRLLNAPALALSRRDVENPTSIEVSLSGYLADLEEPLLASPNCEAYPGQSGVSYRRPARVIAGNPYRVVFDEHFDYENGGRLCSLVLHPYGSIGHPTLPTRYSVVIGTVRLPSAAIYPIEDTEALLDHATPSGKKLQAKAAKSNLPCQLASVGTAGTFPTGVVRDGGDLTFQLRNGALKELCEFTTTPVLEVRDGWAIRKVEWSFSETSLCLADEMAYQEGYGWTHVFYSDDFIYPVRIQAICNPNSKDLPRNSHRYMARLDRIELIGPAGKSWKEAFR